MRMITQVVFDDSINERSVFERMGLGLHAAFPDAEWDNRHDGKQRPKNQDARAQRLLGRLGTKGEAFATEHLTEALGFLDIMIERMEAEAQPEYWQEQIKVVPVEDRDSTKVPLIADPEGVVKLLVEARQQFLDDAVDARNLVEAARPFATPLRVYEEDDE